MTSVPVAVALKNTDVVLLDSGLPYDEKSLKHEPTTNVRSIIFSPNGQYLALRSDKKVEIVRCDDWSCVASLSGPVKDMFFSPLDTYFLVWEMFLITNDHPQGKPNLLIYKSSNGELVKSMQQKNQEGWEPQWSSDEKFYAVLSGSRVLIYEESNFDKYAHQIQVDKLKSFSISPNPGPVYYISVFTTGKGGQPSIWRIFKYPEFETQKALVSRSSFQADKAVFYWNRRGTNLFVLTQTEVDKTGGSYYGKQSLSHGDVKGNGGNMVFGKEGPIHAIAWNPGNWNEWVAVYGHAPAKATVFNAKCEPLFEFGTGAWNTIYYSPDGNHVLLGGFGNIATGNIEVWDLRGYKKVGSCSAPDTTYLQWDPRGECFITATTYPRLTVGNGYKLWHYTCILLHKRQYQEKENLLSILWQQGSFAKSDLSKNQPKGIQDSTPKPGQAYRPPGARNRPSMFTLHEHEKPHRPGGSSSAPSKTAIKQKEKREARKARKAEERAHDSGPEPNLSPTTPRSSSSFVSTGDPDKDKKIKNLNKKLSDIEKLKQQKSGGKKLEVNQLAKIESEKSLLQELAQLKL